MELQFLEELVLEGCFGIDDECPAVLKDGCKSLKVASDCRWMYNMFLVTRNVTIAVLIIVFDSSMNINFGLST